MLFSVEFVVLSLQCRIAILPILLVDLLRFLSESLCMKGQVSCFCCCIYSETCTTAKIVGQMMCPEHLVTPKIDVLGWVMLIPWVLPQFFFFFAFFLPITEFLLHLVSFYSSWLFSLLTCQCQWEFPWSYCSSSTAALWWRHSGI